MLDEVLLLIVTLLSVDSAILVATEPGETLFDIAIERLIAGKTEWLERFNGVDDVVTDDDDDDVGCCDEDDPDDIDSVAT